MADLRERIVEYIQRDYEDNSLEKTLLYEYLVNEYQSQFRVRVKRLYLDARRSGGYASSDEWKALASFVRRCFDEDRNRWLKLTKHLSEEERNDFFARGESKNSYLDIEGLRSLVIDMIRLDKPNKNYNKAMRFYEQEVDAELIGCDPDFVGQTELDKKVDVDLRAELKRLVENRENQITNTNKDMPIRLVDWYLQRMELLGDSVRPQDDHILELMECMNKMPLEECQDSVVPIAIDQRTGGGLYLMGRNQIVRYCTKERFEEFPFGVQTKGAGRPNNTSLILVDHQLGNPEGNGGRIAHNVRVIAPEYALQKFNRAIWERALSRIWVYYRHWMNCGYTNTCWSSFVGRNGKSPLNCPAVFKQYFANDERSRRHPVDLTDVAPSGKCPEGEAIVAQCVLEYFEGRDVVDYKIVRKLPKDSNDGRRACGHYCDLGLVDHNLFAVSGRRVQEDWDKLVNLLRENDSFKKHYLEYLDANGLCERITAAHNGNKRITPIMALAWFEDKDMLSSNDRFIIVQAYGSR